MVVTGGLLIAKAVALSLMDVAARLGLSSGSGAGQSAAATAGKSIPSGWPDFLDHSIGMVKNWSSSGPAGAEHAYSFIFPGTLWCGKGTKAKSFEELGMFKGPDRCCRDHDHCPDSVRSQGEHHGLRNEKGVASLLCACDHKFLHCLREDASVVAREIGKLYFDFLDPVCVTFDYPVRRCKRKARGDSHRCIQYEHDTTRPPEWHFQDFPFFYSSHALDDAVDISTEAAAALSGQEFPDTAANGEDAELWSALLMNRHVRFGTNFGERVQERGSRGWETVIGEQVFPGGTMDEIPEHTHGVREAAAEETDLLQDITDYSEEPGIEMTWEDTIGKEAREVGPERT